MQRIGERSQSFGELGEQAIDFAEFIGLQFADPIARLDRRRWFDEQRGAAVRRVVNQSTNRAAPFPAHRNHVPAIAHRDRHVGHTLVRLEPVHHPLEQCHELPFRIAQLAAEPSKRRRRAVEDRAVIAR